MYGLKNYVQSLITVLFPFRDINWEDYMGDWKEPNMMTEHDDPTPYMYIYCPESHTSKLVDSFNGIVKKD